jgi:cell division GTPase FtsZ
MRAPNTAASITLSVPRLIEDPVVASGCCATLAEDITTQELTAWPGVDAVVIEQAIGQVIVFYHPERVGLETIREALEAIEDPAGSDIVEGGRRA